MSRHGRSVVDLRAYRAAIAAWLLIAIPQFVSSADDATFRWTAQREVAIPQSDRFATRFESIEWDAAKTAVIVCDMWDQHWCPNATERVAEMAPRMNEFLKAARARGATIIHCPSDTMEFYQDAPQRLKAKSTPTADPAAEPLKWKPIDPKVEPSLPIDDSDGGCDCAEPIASRRAWSRQIAALEIADADYIAENAEAYNIIRARALENAVVLGVHTNMCVLGRPFSIRNMVTKGIRVVLCRDLTDAMYNPARPPYVSHFTGVDRVIDHIERYWCPSIVSSDLLGGKEFRFSKDARPHLVAVIAENEYGTETTLTKFIQSELGRSFRTTLVYGDPQQPTPLEGHEAIRSADVLLLSARRRPLPAAQLDLIRAHVAAGKPMVGIRTASHPFHLRNKPAPDGLADWPTFDADVWGGHYTNHYKNELKTFARVLTTAKDHAAVAGLPTEEFATGGSLYQTRPLADGTTILLSGRAESIAEEEPVAWTFTRKDGGRSFYTSLGHAADFDAPPFRRLLLQGLCWAVQINPPAEAPKSAATASDTNRLPTPPTEPTVAQVPGTWDEQVPGSERFDGVAWYRCRVEVPASWTDRGVVLAVSNVDNAAESYVNGTRVGLSGAFPPDYRSGLDQSHQYVVPAGVIQPGRPNDVAIRVYDHDGRGGFKGRAPLLVKGAECIELNGRWELKFQDDAEWGRQSAALAPFALIAKTPDLGPYATVIQRRGQDGALSPRDSLSKLRTPDDLELELVLSEPEISQPLFLNFDERGRLWVMEYRQYPDPAGLKILSKDKWWRAVYDKTPEPPPRGDKGVDRISIHADRDHDGTFETHSVFLDGLNIATSFAFDRDGVWVLNPPYLLFYADRDHDDRPDGAPEVHLEGFGLEDTHSVVNSLRWGNDGWLYAAQGSTVSARVQKPGEKEVVASHGQNIWRYHPSTKRYEIFSEGGGNAFGVEIDALGRIFSGHNGGNTRGFHYAQGAYLQKGFSKHGALGNPFAFGYFPAMTHHDAPRFTHTFHIYQGHTLPGKYYGKLFGAQPMTGQVTLSEMSPDGSTFKTKDLGYAVESDDAWFRPVDVKDGPDGSLYIADWYDGQLAHTANAQGGIDRDHGRVYRLKRKGLTPRRLDELAGMDSVELVRQLDHTNRWHRQTAHRLLRERKLNSEQLDLLRGGLRRLTGLLAIEWLWALSNQGELTPGLAIEILQSETVEPLLRMWTVRLLADAGPLPSDVLPSAVAAVRKEQFSEVRGQYASSARRLPLDQTVALFEALLDRDDDLKDPRLPLHYWWVLESIAARDSNRALDILQRVELWQRPLVTQELAPRLMRRFASTGRREDLLRAARLLAMSPTKEATQAILQGFDQAYAGRSMTGLPPELAAALSASGGASLTLKIRQRDAAALADGLRQLQDAKASPEKRLELVRLFGEVVVAECREPLMEIVARSSDDGLRAAALGALSRHADESIAVQVLDFYPQFSEDVRAAAQELFATRAPWAMRFLDAVAAGTIEAKSVPVEAVRRLSLIPKREVADRIVAVFGNVGELASDAMQRQMERIDALADEGGTPYAGKPLFLQLCGRCHQLHGSGGQIGPDLTPFQRNDARRLLQNIINPSGEIREGFETYVAETNDGRVVVGFLADQDAQTVQLRTATGQTVSLERSEIDALSATRKSLMPERLLDDLSDQQLRDLFSYLRIGQPLND